MAEESGRFILHVPLDASGIKNFKPDRPIKVVAYNRSGVAAGSAVVHLNERGHGQASLTFSEHPGGLRVVVGPEHASDEDLKHLQTLSVNVPPSQWQRGAATTRLSPIIISAFYWDWWLRWCRDYTITGRLVCADGSPVPGATVCAYDVDWWWWWFSEDQVGCAITDANGAFQITFLRCCGWFWWWWEQRLWRVDPVLAERIMPLLQKIPGIRNIPLPDPAPDLKIFAPLVRAAGRAPNLAAAAPRLRHTGARPAFDPGTLETLRAELLAALPASAELERLRGMAMVAVVGLRRGYYLPSYPELPRAEQRDPG
jgi:hypothetical protein